MIGHKVKITSPMAGYKAQILIDDSEAKQVKSIDVRIRPDEVVTITAELYPEETILGFDGADIFIVIGDKKFRLLECEGDL